MALLVFRRFLTLVLWSCLFILKILFSLVFYQNIFLTGPSLSSIGSVTMMQISLFCGKFWRPRRKAFWSFKYCTPSVKLPTEIWWTNLLIFCISTSNSWSDLELHCSLEFSLFWWKTNYTFRIYILKTVKCQVSFKSSKTKFL